MGTYLKRAISVLAFSLLFYFIVDDVQAQVISEPLFTLKGQSELNLPIEKSHFDERQKLTLNTALVENLLNKQIDTFSMPGFESHEYQVEVTRVMEHSNGAMSLLGRISGETHATVSISYSDGKVLSNWLDLQAGKSMKIKFDNISKNHYLYKLSPENEVSFSCELLEIPESDIIKQKFERNPTNRTQVAEIDVMIVYTPAARDTADAVLSGINNVMAQAMANAQLAVDNSEIWIDFRLVHTSEVNYTEGSSSSLDLMRLMVSPTYNPWSDPDLNGYMEEVHDWRDQYGADLVALFTATGDVGGISPMLNTATGVPQWGFSISTIKQAGNFTHAHEMGHNFGNHHSRLQNNAAAPPEGGLFEYSTGWRWIGTDNNHYASLMTYHQSWWPMATRVPLFSNPDIDWQGTPSGSYSGTGSPSDAARSMNEMRHIIADYRPTQVGVTVPGEEHIPQELSLKQNYPNPFNPSTTIMYNLPEAMSVVLEVFDLTGRKVAVLHDGFKSAGNHTTKFDAANLAGGVYIYRLKTGNFIETRKMILVK